jgi:hypothetical protein
MNVIREGEGRNYLLTTDNREHGIVPWFRIRIKVNAIVNSCQSQDQGISIESFQRRGVHGAENRSI